MKKPPASSNGAERVSLQKRVLAAPTLISFAVALVLIVLLVRGFKLDLGATLENIRHSNPGIYVTAFVLYYLSFLLRGARWRLFLHNAGIQKEVSGKLPGVLVCSQFVLLGWFANTISWFRMGDAYRAYLLKERTGASFPKTLGTILAEHVVDILALFVMLLVAIALLLGNPQLRRTGVLAATALGLVIIVVAGLLLLRYLNPALLKFLPEWVREVYQRLRQGILGSLRQLPLIALLCCSIWLVEALRVFLVTQALGYSVAIPFVLFVTLAHALLIIVPITPAGLGIAETGMAGVLSLTLAPEQAVSVAILDRSITYLSVVIIGAALLLVRQVRSAVNQRSTRSQKRAAG